MHNPGLLILFPRKIHLEKTAQWQRRLKLKRNVEESWQTNWQQPEERALTFRSGRTGNQCRQCCRRSRCSLRRGTSACTCRHRPNTSWCSSGESRGSVIKRASFARNYVVPKSFPVMSTLTRFSKHIIPPPMEKRVLHTMTQVTSSDVESNWPWTWWWQLQQHRPGGQWCPCCVPRKTSARRRCGGRPGGSSPVRRAAREGRGTEL